MKTKTETSAYILRSSAGVLVFSYMMVVALSSAINVPNHPGSASSAAAPVIPKNRTLTFADRVAYQRAIEEVYWRHRIWPEANADPKPPLYKVMSQAQIENRVEDYLRDSQALEDYWQRPITPDQLQAEMERIASHTKQPGVLRELFAALDNDPLVIAECLTRPVLAKRLLAELYAHDDRLHSELKRCAEAELRTATMATVSAEYTLPAISGQSGSWSPSVNCTNNTWTATSTAGAPAARVYHTAVWTGTEMIVWGGNFPPLNTGGRYNPTTDSWTATSTAGAPGARENHTAVWTGTEMIIWGGAFTFPPLNTGGRYNPSTDTWRATSTTNAPDGRYWHTAVWDGHVMIIWGGNNGTFLTSGGRYNPVTNSWTATSTFNIPAARGYHTAVWTGSQMIVWGGTDNFNYWNTGGRYNPTTNSWTAIGTTNAPAGRWFHTAVWTGNEMIIWGGADADGSYLNTGGRYNPSIDSWTATSTAGAPARQGFHTTVWTGSEMIIWGGANNGSYFNTGGRYNPATDSWRATSTTNAPDGRLVHTAVWTGSQMIVWGGRTTGGPVNTGGRYCAQAPPTPTPTPTPTHTPTPTATATPVPGVITRPATNVASFSATLNGSLNPRGSATMVYFQYGLTTTYGNTTPMQTQNGNTVRAVSANISGLSASHTYHFRIVARNGGGTVFGSDGTFTTLTATGPPIVMTNPATHIGSFSARLHGSLNPHGLAATVYFQYGTTTSYGSTTANQTKSGNTYQNVVASISGLTANTTYHFRIVATNNAGTVFGTDKKFTTFRKDESVAFQNNVVHDGSDPASPLVPPLTVKWRRNFSASGVRFISYPLIADGRVFVTTTTSGPSGFEKLMALDARTGSTLWSANVNGRFGFANAAYDSGRVFVVNYDGLVKAFDAATGTLLWSLLLPYPTFGCDASPIAVNGRVYISGFGYGGDLYAVDETNGAVLLTMSVNNGDTSPVFSSGRVFVSDACPNAFAFNAVTGQQLWHFNSCCSGGGNLTPVLHAGGLYARDSYCTQTNGIVLDVNNGHRIGLFNSDTPPGFIGNLTLLPQNGTLVAVNSTGQQVWSFVGDGALQSAPLVVNQTIYIGSRFGMLYGLNANGQMIWSTRVGGSIPTPEQPTVTLVTGLGAGEGLLVVPTATTLVAYGN
ncbi:MAG TPA: PQQ-binding-like beta-propeller repeat protein [Candidatus Udaeobacter sp.]|nr:PQQ-binding-like beta-propeller repeat protein [Candidatus Udaeobacter sp.]